VAEADDQAPTAADSTTGTEPKVYRQYRYSPPPGSCELLIVRHGESAPFIPGQPFPRVDGQEDPPLADEGRWQAKQLADRLDDDPIDAIYVTNLQRTAQTAAPLAERLGLTPTVVPELREVHLGEWEAGLFRQKTAEGDPIAGQMFTEQRWDVIPGAETHEQLEARIIPALERIAADHPDQRVMVVVHGGVIATILAHASGSRPFAFLGADNGSISHLVIEPRRWHIRRYNDTGHLDGELSIEGEPIL
jgi:probable phosphoglycerate mutase